ncbi:hypothetical protein [Sphingosinicella sp. BN140058]|uniref:hypothetical protein n=1 Tax=Sphingosinicella sp. BN140058 TaxID=1892855 RepID=UPI0010109335|nr:hypothetical protein [Sphingosinicella sp. BN140058]QAY76106.1 hypothetical protein ETR14_05860 [Sphingosinicella sp. BN140058]
MSANDPDSIGVEIYDPASNMLFDVTVERDRAPTIMFDDACNAEFDVGEFHALLERCVGELDAWKQRLEAPGEIWNPTSTRADGGSVAQ